MSFTRWDGINEAVFIGFDNYKRLFSSVDLPIAIRNGIIYSVFLTTYQIGLGTLFAYILSNINIKGKRFFRNLYFFPVLLSVSVVGQLWVSIYHSDFGLINQLSKNLGFNWSQNWLVEPIKGILAIVLAESWKGMGYHMLIIYAAMRNVPQSYYEASLIDGATEIQQFFKITIPLVSQTIKVCFIMCITFGFRAFELIFVMTGGGPGNYSYTVPIMMYKALFKLREYGYANAISAFIVIICTVIMLVIDKLARTE